MIIKLRNFHMVVREWSHDTFGKFLDQKHIIIKEISHLDSLDDTDQLSDVLRDEE